MNLSLAEMARRLTELEARVPQALSQGLDAAAAALELAASAKAAESAVAAGLTDAALVNALRDSIGREVKGLEAAIGSNANLAVVLELGSVQTPPHPFGCGGKRARRGCATACGRCGDGGAGGPPIGCRRKRAHVRSVASTDEQGFL
ncbi:hypothetical protein [Ralstonia sp. 1B3]|uniref:hypothetical protein n=1 Tax=Ralstonia sp. 1B3 TaxID=2997421 RepID=UPI002FC5E06F